MSSNPTPGQRPNLHILSPTFDANPSEELTIGSPDSHSPVPTLSHQVPFNSKIKSRRKPTSPTDPTSFSDYMNGSPSKGGSRRGLSGVGGGGGGGGTSGVRRHALALLRYFGLGRQGGRQKWVLVGITCVLTLWLFFGEGTRAATRGGKSGVKGAARKERLLHRWWESNSTGLNPALSSRPQILLSRPRPSAPSLYPSHTLSQLQRLSSTFSPSHPPTWAGIVHLSSTSQIALLATLVPSLQKQSLPPQKIVLLYPETLSVDLKSISPPVDLGIISATTYSPSESPSLALIRLANSPDLAEEMDHLLILDSHIESLHSTYARILLRASGTKEYSSTILSSGGLTLPNSNSLATQSTCKISESAPGSDSLLLSLRNHIPTTPFLVKTTWLANLSQGLRSDFPIELAIALALYQRAGIPSFGLPVNNDGNGKRDWGCDRLKRDLTDLLEGEGGLQGGEVALGAMFGKDRAGGAGLRKIDRERVGGKLSVAGGGGGDEEREEGGTTVFLLSGEEELEIWRGIICDISFENPVRVFIADYDTSKTKTPTSLCHIDLHLLSSYHDSDSDSDSHSGESLQSSLITSLESLHTSPTTPPISIIFLTASGTRSREFNEVLRWGESLFSLRRGGGEEGRMTKEKMRKWRGSTVIALERDEVILGEWIGRLPVEALRYWHVPRIDISVITNNRPASLARLLTALDSAYYFGDDITLAINLEQTADKTTHQLVDNFQWSFGTLSVRHRVVLGGLIPAIVESWYPANNDSYGVFLEDDVEVSPMFYGWLKFTILYYRYYEPMREQSSRLFGVSLYQQRNIELRPEGRQTFDPHKIFKSLSIEEDLPYLSQIPCSWGAVYFPEIWKEFHLYLSLRFSEQSLSISEFIVPDISSNRWARSWKKYFIELVYLRGYVMLYPNYVGFDSFSTNHLEKGDHAKAVDLKRKSQFAVPLMTTNGSLIAMPGGKLPEWETMPIIDFWGSISTDEEIIERGWQTIFNLDTCPTPPRVDILPTYNAKELLCPRNYDRVNSLLVKAKPLMEKGLDEIAGIKGEEKAMNAPPIVQHPDRAAAVEEPGKVGEDAEIIIAPKGRRPPPPPQRVRAQVDPRAGSEQTRHSHDDEDVRDEYDSNLKERLLGVDRVLMEGRGKANKAQAGRHGAIDFDDLIEDGGVEEVRLLPDDR